MLVPWDSLGLGHAGRERRSSARLKSHCSSALCPFFYFNKLHVQVQSLHFSADQHDWTQEPAWSGMHLVPGEGKEAVHRSWDTYKLHCWDIQSEKMRLQPRNCDSWFNFFQDIRFRSDSFGQKKTVLPFFISDHFYQFPVSRIKPNSRWYSHGTKTLNLPLQ